MKVEFAFVQMIVYGVNQIKLYSYTFLYIIVCMYDGARSLWVGIEYTYLNLHGRLGYYVCRKYMEPARGMIDS